MLKYLLVLILLQVVKSEYYVGMGIDDITGPPVEANFMGYANPAQIGKGIHIRIYSRAFIFADLSNKTRFVFASVDCGMISQIVKTEVVDKLKLRFGDLYTEKNVALSSTHSHSGPGGFHQYILFDITSLGFVKETFEAMTEGIYQSIVKAHYSMEKSRIYMHSDETLINANINRSPTSYLANPPEERALYKHDTDKIMVLLKIVSSKTEQPTGMINWFAVHGTSMNNTNKLVSGDNKGYASMMFERLMNNNTRPGKGKFVAAFAQSNLGDVSPNTKGARCIDSGLPCEKYTSTCHGKNEQCIASGPGKDMFESTKIIGDRQYQHALNLFNQAEDEGEELEGPIQFTHQFKNMTNLRVKLQHKNGSVSWGRTCLPAMGYSFAAGTTDGPGAFNFKQGSNKTNLFWDLVRDVIHDPSSDLIKCHAPKPILLATGELTFPHLWQPRVVETQLMRIGNLVIAPIPGEFTTMSGRRMRKTIANTISKLENSTSNYTVVIAGLSNTYADYIATFEEYQKQRYEAASTIYGPHTLEAYLSQYTNLTEALFMNTTLPSGPSPPFSQKTPGFLPPVLFDNPGIGKHFGQVIQQPLYRNYSKGSVVSVKFVGANPRNRITLDTSHCYVEKYNTDGKTWDVVYDDADWETKFQWKRTGVVGVLFGESTITIDWDIPTEQDSGKYRIRYLGTSKSVFDKFSDFEGLSREFVVM